VDDNPYKELLGLDPALEHPTYYELLGLPPEHATPDSIDREFKARMTKLQHVKSPKHKGFIEFLKDELRKAKRTLADAARRKDYDAAQKKKRIETFTGIVEPLLALGNVPPDVLETLVTVVASKHGLAVDDARAVVEAIAKKVQVDLDEEPAPGKEAPPAFDGNRTFVLGKPGRARPPIMGGRLPGSSLALLDLLEALSELGDAAFVKRFPSPFLLEVGPADAPRRFSEVAKLRVLPLERRDKKGGEVTLGRGIAMDVRLESDSVSSRHAVFKPARPGRFSILDTVSTNGTYVDGVRILPGTEVELREVSVLRFGETVLVFHASSSMVRTLRHILDIRRRNAFARSGVGGRPNRPAARRAPRRGPPSRPS